MGADSGAWAVHPDFLGTLAVVVTLAGLFWKVRSWDNYFVKYSTNARIYLRIYLHFSAVATVYFKTFALLRRQRGSRGLEASTGFEERVASGPKSIKRVSGTPRTPNPSLHASSFPLSHRLVSGALLCTSGCLFSRLGRIFTFIES